MPEDNFTASTSTNHEAPNEIIRAQSGQGRIFLLVLFRWSPWMLGLSGPAKRDRKRYPTNDITWRLDD